MDQTSNPAESWSQTIEHVLVSHETQLTHLDSCLSQQQEPLTRPQLPHPGNPLEIHFGFLLQSAMVVNLGAADLFFLNVNWFSTQPSAFSSHCAKVDYVLSLLTICLKKWATAEWSRQASYCSSFKDFSTELKKVLILWTLKRRLQAFNPSTLLCLTQASGPVIEYILDFRSARTRRMLLSGSLTDPPKETSGPSTAGCISLTNISLHWLRGRC